MSLTLAKLQELQSEAFAEDVFIEFEKMQHWTEEQASEYFVSGGQNAPPDTEPDLGDLVLDEDDLEAVPQPVFQSGGDTSMVAKEADKETAGSKGGLEAPPARGGASAQASGGVPERAADGTVAAKAVLVGDSGVGKTSLLMRFSQDLFREQSKATVGVDLHTRSVTVPSTGKPISMQLWDTAGQEQFQSLTASYFRAAHAVVLAYDVHSPSSFAALPKWMMEVDRHAPAEVVKLVLGMKADGGPAAPTPVSAEEAAAFAAKHGALCERCSAKEGLNVLPLFEALADKLVRNGFDPDGARGARAGARGASAGGLRVKGGTAGGKKKGCC